MYFNTVHNLGDSSSRDIAGQDKARIILTLFKNYTSLYVLRLNKVACLKDATILGCKTCLDKVLIYSSETSFFVTYL